MNLTQLDKKSEIVWRHQTVSDAYAAWAMYRSDRAELKSRGIIPWDFDRYSEWYENEIRAGRKP